MFKPPIALFDLDGTLAETGPDLCSALNMAVATIGIPPVSTEFLNFALGQGGRIMLKRTLQAHDIEPTEERLDDLLPVFLAHYEAHMPGETYFFDGVLDLIDDLRTGGWRTAICTNKSQHLAESLIGKLGKDHLFDAICGGDRFEWRKPDGRHLLSTAELAGGDPEKAIMFGDSVSDIDGAKSAGMPIIAVPFGYTDRPVRELDPDLVIASYREIDVARIASLAGA